jgi:hypothetical protein
MSFVDAYFTKYRNEVYECVKLRQDIFTLTDCGDWLNAHTIDRKLCISFFYYSNAVMFCNSAYRYKKTEYNVFPHNEISFQEFLELAPEEYKSFLLFNLDIFSSVPFER